jgi:hypothetical protein
MPVYLDFVFPFAGQESSEGSRSSGFHEDTRLLSSKVGLCIPALGRSGREIRLCYSLRSAEKFLGYQEWFIRQAVIYHSFDVESGKSFWVVIKPNQRLQDRIKTKTGTAKEARKSGLRSFNTTAEAFSSSLEAHLVVCDWCDEDWGQCLDYLEKRLQENANQSPVFGVPREPTSVEKAGEITRVLKSNIGVLKELKRHYEWIIDSNDYPRRLKNDCEDAVARFETRISNIIADLQRQLARIEDLQGRLTTTEDRTQFLGGTKNMVYFLPKDLVL